ncbi:Nucleic acid-binding OB-fold [Arabidopsis suecica]|uniref:Nucleic acid-binding OB-fold n=1 Tax=Arabidopsis suecica TaxID=45249 RepID=A0A8T2BBW5_ARASU|nr:Nucleic acid-binding OB-fold [Arabidopsis suecica]
MAKKRDSPKLIKIKDAINLIHQQVSLIGIVLEQREPKQCRTNDWICTLRIIDDTYPSPGFTVNVFSNTLEELPQIKNHDDMILFTRIKMQTFDSGKRVSAACNKRVSSFALFEGEDFVCYQCTSNFHEEEALYKSAMADLRKFFASRSEVVRALQSISYRTEPCSVETFSFLREIKIGKRFDLVVRILHADEDMSAVFVWDGTDAPPTSILAKRSEEDKAFSSLSVHTLLSRDILLSFPTVGTILRVSLSSHLFRRVKPGDWVKLYQLLCEVDKGSWVIKVTNSTVVRLLAQDDRLVEKIMRIYDKRLSSKLGHIPFWCFPSPPGLTETDENCAPFVTLMDIITFPKVTCKYRCIVRVVTAYPWQVDDFCSNENRLRVLLTLEDPTATLEAFLCDKDAEYFWGLGFQDTETLRKKRNWLLGIRESSNFVAPRNPPWIECCILSYYTNKADPWKTRLYRIFGTRLLN